MSERIPQDFIDDLIERADIAEVIGRRVEIKKAGKEFAEHTKDLSLLFVMRLLRDTDYQNPSSISDYIEYEGRHIFGRYKETDVWKKKMEKEGEEKLRRRRRYRRTRFEDESVEEPYYNERERRNHNHNKNDLREGSKTKLGK